MKGAAHRSHDYLHLVRRWKAVAERAGLRLSRLQSSDPAGVFYLRSPALAATGGLYVSAGIHGDEAGGTEGLLRWAETNARRLARWPVLLLPCLNPWGLKNNRRCDADGVDLNRSFHRDDLPLITSLKRLAAGHRFDLAMMLHEDYDGEGLYLYEIARAERHWGDQLLTAGGRVIAPDSRPKIEGRLAELGLIRRRYERRRFQKIGYPEAIWLYESKTGCAITAETPSEFALGDRAKAHAALLDESVRLLGW